MRIELLTVRIAVRTVFEECNMVRLFCFAVVLAVGLLSIERHLNAAAIPVPAGDCKSTLRGCGVGSCTTPLNCKSPSDCLC